MARPRRRTVDFGNFSLGAGTLALCAALLALSALARFGLAKELEVVPGAVLHGHLWQLVTSGFVEGGVTNILFTLLAVGVLGNALEGRWGTQRLVVNFLAYTAVGGVAWTLLGVAFSPLREVRYLGAWPAIAAFTVFYALEMPDRPIFAMFVLPLSGRQLIYFELFMIALVAVFDVWFHAVPPAAALAMAYALYAGGASPRRLVQRWRAWWLERRLKKRRLRVVEEITRPPQKDGSSKYLH